MEKDKRRKWLIGLMVVVGCGIAVGAVAALVFMLLGDANVDVVAVLGYAAFGAVIGLFCLPIVFMKRKKIVLWILFVLAICWGLTVLVGSSSGVDMLTFLLGAIGGIAIGIPTAVAFVVLLVNGIRSDEAWYRAFPGVFVVHCIFLLFVVTATWFDLPFRTRFAMSEQALEKAAMEILAETRSDEPTEIGWFDVSYVRVWEGAVSFTVGAAGFSDYCVVYCPDGLPERLKEEDCEHITGAWYDWVYHW